MTTGADSAALTIDLGDDQGPAPRPASGREDDRGPGVPAAA
ncbi:hypothetical protein [Serinicoccus marinus]|nr:hypothetical protein [Serinicoccus marinus]